MKKIGIFGGSFDPPHLGHKALVQAALDVLPLDEVWVVPVGVPVHRALTPNISAQQRLAWVKLMFDDIPNVRVMDWEVQRYEAVPSIETMRNVANRMDAVPYWLMGMDAWKGLPSWVGYPEHRGLCNMLVFSRQGEVKVQHCDWLEVTALSGATAGHVCHVEIALPDVSATQIRQDILTGKDVSTVLDVHIADEIQSAYKDKSSNGENE